MYRKIYNVKIDETFLGREEHGILTCYLYLSGFGFGAVLGGRALDKYDESANRRIATQKGFELIDRILKIVGVQKWEDVAGKYIRVEVPDFGKKITKIGNLIKEDWLDFEEYFSEQGK